MMKCQLQLRPLKTQFNQQIGNTKVIKEGYGVVAAITPWNYPLIKFNGKSTCFISWEYVVVKPASDTPLTAVKLFELAEK